MVRGMFLNWSCWKLREGSGDDSFPPSMALPGKVPIADIGGEIVTGSADIIRKIGTAIGSGETEADAELWVCALGRCRLFP